MMTGNPSSDQSDGILGLSAFGVEQQHNLLGENAVNPSNADILKNITSEEFIKYRTQWLIGQLSGEHDSQMGHVARLFGRSRIKYTESIDA